MPSASLLFLLTLAAQPAVPPGAPPPLPSAETPPTTVTEAIDRCEMLEYPAPPESIKVVEAGLALNEPMTEAQRGLLQSCKAGALLTMGEMDEARRLTLEIDPLADDGRSGDPRDRVGLMIRLAQLHFRGGDSITALESMDAALQLAEDEPLDDDLPQVLGNLAIFLTEAGQFEAAIGHFERILVLADAEQAAMEANPSMQPSIPLIPVRFNFARALMLSEQPDRAIPHLEWLSDAMDVPGLEPRRASALAMLAAAYGQLGDERAAATMDQAVALHETFDNPGERGTLRLDQTRLALEQGDLEAAEGYAREALELSRLIEYDRSILSALELLVDILSQQGQHEEALMLHREYAALNQEFLEKTQASRLDLLETRLGVQRRDAELVELRRTTEVQELRLQQEAFRRQVAWTALIAVALSAIGLSLWQRAHQKRLLRISRTDSLTGLPNRRYLTLQMQQQGDSSNAALVLLDLDHFKQINDSHGHDVGDRVLVAVSECIRSVAERHGALCGRWGGEEFALFLPEANADASRALAEALRRAVEQLDIDDGEGMPVSVTASLGFAPIRGLELDSGQELWEPALKCADQLLYRAKHAGRNCGYGAWPRSDDVTINPLALEKALTAGEFRLITTGNAPGARS
jgi:diguanylate cyclase (GGDEF)-like protein